MHLTTSPLDWYAARAAGIVAYVLLTSVVVLGLTMAGRKKLRVWPRFAVEDVHRFGGLLVGTFLGVHVLAIAIDAFLPFSLWSIVVPFVSRYRPLWVALGIVATELLVALAFANHYRNRFFSYRFWRRTHYANFVVWVAATLHGLGSGTDRSTWWLLTIFVVAAGAVSGATALRVLGFSPPTRARLRYAPFAAAFGAALVVLVLALGPLRFHHKAWNPANFHEGLAGQVVEDAGPTRGILSLAGNGVGRQHLLVRADLLIGPERLLATSFQMEYLPSGLRCRGRVSKVHDRSFEATCMTQTGGRRFVSASWQPSLSNELVGGVISVRS